MNTLTTQAEVDPEGWLTIHTPAPIGMRPGKMEVVLVLPSPPAATSLEAVDCLRKIAERGGLGIKDPVAWQREVRQERPLPGRN